MTKRRPVPDPVPQPKVSEGVRAVPIYGRVEGSNQAIVAWALVDEADFSKVICHRWSFAGKGYVRTGANSFYMHRLILETDLQVDHENGDKLDNRRSNLRSATNSQNHSGFSGRSPGSSGYRGVVRDKKKWMARVWFNGEVRAAYGFATPQEAAVWRDQTAKELHGEFFVSTREGR